VLSVTDNEATRPTFVRTRPAMHEAKNEAEAGCYEAEAKNFGLKARLADSGGGNSRTFKDAWEPC